MKLNYQNQFQIPRLASRLLEKAIGHQIRNGAIGDFYEHFFWIIQNRNYFIAKTWIWIQVIILISISIFEVLSWRMAMLRNHLKTSFRILNRFKLYSLINIFGMALGLACCFLIFLWIADEESYDHFHDSLPQLFRVINHLDYGPMQKVTERCGFPLAPTLKEEIPEIIASTHFYPCKRQLLSSPKNHFFEDGFCFVDQDFFSMFSFDLTVGKDSQLLTSPNSLIITKEMATKYFGELEPIGQTITTNNNYTYIVCGILKNTPPNTDLHFDFLAPIEAAVAQGIKTHWTAWMYPTYVQLQSGSSSKDINQKLKRFGKDHGDQASTYSLQPLNEVHFNGLGEKRLVKTITFFSALAILILTIACLNYINLSTAQAQTRFQEIGIRKMAGADRKKIIIQILNESIVLALLALVIGMALTALFLPTFNQFANKKLVLSTLFSTQILLQITTLSIVTGLVAGSYAAFSLGSLQVINVLKGQAFKKPGKWQFNIGQILIILQFVLSVLLMIGVSIVGKQMHFVHNQNLGLDKQHVIYLNLQGESNLWASYQTLKRELKQCPGVMHVTASTRLPFADMASEWGQLDWPGKTDEHQIVMNHMAVETNFANTFKLKMMQGRFFDEMHGDDQTNFVLNESAIKASGIENPIGKPFRLLKKSGTIIGVIKDFHFSSFRQQIEPLILHTMPYPYWAYDTFAHVRLQPSNIQESLTAIERIWNRIYPSYPFEVKFLDDQYNGLYQNEQRLAKILRFFSALAIIISCLGLFGLTSFIVERHTKSIGIRKVLGASVCSISFQFIKVFMIRIFLANLIAWPLAYWLLNRWIKQFVYRTPIGWEPFVVSMIISTGLTLLTVGYETLTASLAKPTHSLRYE